MAQLGGRRTPETRSADAANGPKVWLETCSSCGREMTVFSATKPSEPRCLECGPKE